jgi:hypothetical protein
LVRLNDLSICGWIRLWSRSGAFSLRLWVSHRGTHRRPRYRPNCRSSSRLVERASNGHSTSRPSSSPPSMLSSEPPVSSVARH